jgi:hypothetical protein
MKQRMKTRPHRKPIIRIGSNEDIDWTPQKNRLYPRVLTVKQGDFLVRIEEARSAPDDFSLWVGARFDGAGDAEHCLCNLFGDEFKPGELDTLIALLSFARDKARELGMPSDKREGAAA